MIVQYKLHIKNSFRRSVCSSTHPNQCIGGKPKIKAKINLKATQQLRTKTANIFKPAYYSKVSKENQQIKQKGSNNTEYKQGSTSVTFPASFYKLTVNQNKQKASKNLFWGALLFSRGDLAFINLCGLLSSLLKVLHVCLFATLNNKRIVFVADQRPLVQEHQQTLLNYFISCQVNSFSTKVASKLPLLLPYSSAWQKEWSLKSEINNVSASVSLQQPLQLSRSSGYLKSGKLALSNGGLLSFGNRPLVTDKKVQQPLRENKKTKKMVTLSPLPSLKRYKSTFWGPLLLQNQFINDFVIKDKYKKKSSLFSTMFKIPDHKLFQETKSLSSAQQNHESNTKIFNINYNHSKSDFGSLGKNTKQVLSLRKSNGEAWQNHLFFNQRVENAEKLESKAKKLNNSNKADFGLQTQPLLLNQIIKLVSKVAVRSSQWTATLAQPTNSWIGGFFSNSLASYRQNLSSATLLNIRIEPRSFSENSSLYENKSKNAPLQVVTYKNNTQLNGNSTFDTRKNSVPKKQKSKVFSNNLCTGNKPSLLKASKEQIKTLIALTNDLEWKAISCSPVAKKNWASNSNVKKEKVLGFQNKQLLRSFWGPLKSNRLSNSYSFKKQKLHRKVLNNCAKLASKNSKNAWLKEADLVFFTNPEKNQSLLNQINRLQIPTIGIINSGSFLSKGVFKSVKGHSILSNKPVINYPIIGNSNSLNFLRIVLTKIASVLNH